MNAPTDRLAQQVAAATQRLGQLKARQLLREMRDAARVKARTRREDVRRRLELAGAVLTAGCGDCEMPELVGLMLDGRERIEASPTIRMGLRKRGEANLTKVRRGLRSTIHRSELSGGAG